MPLLNFLTFDFFINDFDIPSLIPQIIPRGIYQSLANIHVMVRPYPHEKHHILFTACLLNKVKSIRRERSN